MLTYNNNHIFTGYLKQLLSSFGLPACKIYTREFAEYVEKYGEEDPRVLESFNSLKVKDADDGVAGTVIPATRINYLKHDKLCNYFYDIKLANRTDATWMINTNIYYDKDRFVPGLTRYLNSPGITYDTKTHEYLGDFLRFIRDYYNINLMSLYNCFTDKIYNNIYFPFVLNPEEKDSAKQIKVVINAQEPEYKLYALPVKLFAEYTIAIDCDQGIELFCGIYNTKLDISEKAQNLAARTYQKVSKTLFSQPFLYKKLGTDDEGNYYWSDKTDFKYDTNNNKLIRTDVFTRWELTNHEKDLKLFIKVPVSCKSSITVLEGDFVNFNDKLYTSINGNWQFNNNHCVLNFSNDNNYHDLNDYAFKPISQLQLLAFNTGESYPFADRLIEYLCGSAITPIDEIPDNIKRVQRVMRDNNYYFRIEGLWEPKMQNIIYDYIMNSGPVAVSDNGKLIDKRSGYHRRLGHTSKSTLFDVLGYIDKDAEKWYACWKKDEKEAVVKTSLQTVDIYDGLYDI